MSDTSLLIEATSRSPEVRLDAAAGVLSMSGESYPEDASAFFGPVFNRISEYFDGAPDKRLTADMRFIYFNSSSAKAIMNLFQMLEQAAENGASVIINWYFDPDDDMMEEMGEDFSEDFEHATFNLRPETEAA